MVQRIYDGGGVQPIAQWLFAPMIDDRTAADASLDASDYWVWNSYLPDVTGTDRGATTAVHHD